MQLRCPMEPREASALLPRLTLAEIDAEESLKGQPDILWLDANLPARCPTERPVGLDEEIG